MNARQVDFELSLGPPRRRVRRAPHRAGGRRPAGGGLAAAADGLLVDVADARATLDDMLRHGLFTIDYENRRLGWYNEGLAFHHSQQMSVDRMVPALGYVAGNIVLCCLQVNMVKQNLSIDQLIDLLEEMKAHHNRGMANGLDSLLDADQELFDRRVG